MKPTRPGPYLSPCEASPTDVHRLSAALAAAFEQDPIFSWLLPNENQRFARLVRFFGLELQHVVPRRRSSPSRPRTMLFELPRLVGAR